MTLLHTYIQKYVRGRSLSAGYEHCLIKRMAKLEQFADCCDLKDLFQEDIINKFLATLAGRLSPYTINKYRADILAVWRAAADEDLVVYPIARRIRREKTNPQVIECFSIDEARAIVKAAEAMKGGAYPNGVAKRHFWPAVLRFSWDTGLRRGDCWRFEMSMLKRDNTFRIVQAKTRKAIRRILRPDTVAAMKRINRARPLEWSICEWCFGTHFQNIRAAAGIERGTFRWFRRASGSEVEALHPGAGHKALGNTEQVFRQHYDAQIGEQVFAPPAL